VINVKFISKVMGGLILACILFEVSCRVWTVLFPDRIPYRTYYSYIAEPFPAHEPAPYWSKEFFTEVEHAKFPYCDHDLHTPYHNVVNCNRVVVGQPQDVSRRVWMFGTSTLLGWEMPDEYTIPSQLQAILPTWRVEFITHIGTSIYTLSDFIKELNIAPGDIVITMTSPTDSLSAWAQPESTFDKFCWIAMRDYKYKFYSIRPFCWRTSEPDPKYLTDEYIAPLIEAFRIKHRGAVNELREYITAKGAHYIHIGEPAMWSSPLNDREKMIDQEYYNGYIRIMLPRFWDVTRQHVDLDLFHALDEARKTHVVYFDGWHQNHIGTPITAKAIADYILQHFPETF
jgi:hypothetical protein